LTFIWARKRPSGVLDYYLRRTERVNGKPKVVMNLYLGTAEKILELVQGGGLAKEEFELVSFQFGTVATIARVDVELALTETVREVTKSDATADALLSFVCGRSEEPVSKNAMDEWSKRSAIRFLRALPSLSCRSYLRYMDRLTPEHVRAISFRIAERLVQMGHDPSIVFFDTTNFSTEQQPRGDDERTLPRAGHAKDHNMQAKLVGLATATTNSPSYIPIMHETFPGNEQDATVFQKTIGSMIETLTKLGVKCEDLCFVFDKGMNSQPGFTALAGSRVHFVSALKVNQVREFLSMPMTAYSGKHVTAQGEEILTLRGKDALTVMGVTGSVVVAYNASAEKRQSEDYESAKKRFLGGCREIAGSLAAASSGQRRGRPPTVEGTNRRVMGLIPNKWTKVFRFRVGNTLDSNGKVSLTYWVDKRSEGERRKSFGKTTIFTDMAEWSDERIVRTYFARGGMEEDYHVLKDVLLLPVMPIYHRLDRRVEAHVFMCVLGLLLYRYIQWRIEKETGERIPMGRMASILRRVRLGGLVVKGSHRVRFKLERMGEEEAKIVKALQLEEFVPN